MVVEYEGCITTNMVARTVMGMDTTTAIHTATVMVTCTPS
jgi:hypothetical protein